MSLFMVRGIGKMVVAASMTRTTSVVARTIVTGSSRRALAAGTGYGAAPAPLLATQTIMRTIMTSAPRRMTDPPNELRQKKKIALACMAFAGFSLLLVGLWGSDPIY